MTEQDKRQWLERYLPIVLRIEGLQEERRSLYDRAGFPTPSTYGEIRLYSQIDKLQHCLEGVEDIEDQIRREFVTASRVRSEVVAVIDAMPNSTLQQLLRYRYIDGLIWEKVAEKMNYSYRRVLQLHKKALEQVQIEASSQKRF